MRHITVMRETEVQIQAILFILALVSGAMWLLGELVLFWLDIDASALRDHRDVLGLIFLVSVSSLLVSAVTKHDRDSEGST